ncbi:UbiD family decarboxylase [Candidatus Ishikawella capsulata]|uniref:3-octaprenyl-4-hydroxybenzoate decarboxylase n=1 Tax=Candidatus Ishikawaella capsulata Mpkobe TaxID=476281 RepID=C5WCB3_9ENTR|nr:UbiD family decarboxylase [Candidatus Ishikawaella capsulata]BAH82969.1 3-octaprenyl-4-hydroxybenzoate decarboxylase [Candidatus Ishikawaella capsulata Mpkobe]
MYNRQKTEINDLRSAIEFLQKIPGQYVETHHEVNPNCELAGIYKLVGAGGTVQRPTKIGPAMLFNNIKGYNKIRILVGLLASRNRVGWLLGSDPKQLTYLINQAILHPISPKLAGPASALCQEVIWLAKNKNFDIRTILPAITNTTNDAGPYFCMGLVLAEDPTLGMDVTIHRLCVQNKDELTIFFAPGRHIDVFRQRAESKGKKLSITINIGLDPAIYIGSCFEAPITPLGFNELAIAGSIRQKPIKLVKALTVDAKCIGSAEIVIEGFIEPGRYLQEDYNTQTGYSMPEFLGYSGNANPSLPIIKVTAITTRQNPILQTIVGPGEEHVNLVGLPTEASIFNALNKAMPGFISEVYAHSSGGGKLLVILKCNKKTALDDGRVRQAALLAFGIYSELKNIILVDEDVDIYDSDDILWAMTTRFQGNYDLINIPGVSGHILDPSQMPEYNSGISTKGITNKSIFDCTVPFQIKDKFQRAQFQYVDITPFINK